MNDETKKPSIGFINVTGGAGGSGGAGGDFIILLAHMPREEQDRIVAESRKLAEEFKQKQERWEAERRERLCKFVGRTIVAVKFDEDRLILDDGSEIAPGDGEFDV